VISIKYPVTIVNTLAGRSYHSFIHFNKSAASQRHDSAFRFMDINPKVIKAYYRLAYISPYTGRTEPRTGQYRPVQAVMGRTAPYNCTNEAQSSAIDRTRLSRDIVMTRTKMNNISGLALSQPGNNITLYDSSRGE